MQLKAGGFGRILAGLIIGITMAGCSGKPSPLDAQSALSRAIDGAGVVKDFVMLSTEQVELMRTPAWKVAYSAKVELASDFRVIRRGSEASTARELLNRLGSKALGKEAILKKKGAIVEIKGTITLMSQDKVWAPMGFGE